MSDEKPPSTEGSGRPSLWQRLVQALRGQPRSREEIVEIIRDAQTESVFHAEEQAMLQGVLEVAETQVRDVMIPRSQMVVLEHDQTLAEMLEIIVRSGHSRFPVIGEDRDQVLGILLAKDLLRFFGEPEKEPDVERLLRRPVFIPESKRLNTLLNEFRESHNHMAIVVDEYGGVSGLLTIEDVIEEIVGEIDDEHDPEADVDIQPQGERDGREVYRVRALTRIEDFNQYFDTDFSDEDYDTIGGLVMHELGRLPRRGERIHYGGFQFTVTRADRRRVELLEAVAVPEEAVA